MDLESNYYIELSNEYTTVHFGLVKPPIIEGRDALEGWYSTPDSKVESTERQAGHGAFNITKDMILYSARTVTLKTSAIAGDRAEVLDILEQIQLLAGTIVKVRVVDGERDTFATGYIETNWEADRWFTANTGEITIVCPDPRRYSMESHIAALVPMYYTDGGLVFDDNGNMEVNPVTFYGETQDGNVAIVANNGTSTAYPEIRISGSWPSGVILTTSEGQLWYKAAINWNTLVIDCLTRTGSINGVDVTRNFASRDFPSIEPGGNIRLSCLSGGNGGITISVRDTYL